MVIFHSYVSLPEGIRKTKMVQHRISFSHGFHHPNVISDEAGRMFVGYTPTEKKE